MAITRLALEAALRAAAGNLVALAAEPAVRPLGYTPPDVAATGSNPTWTDAIQYAALKLGAVPASPGAIADADLAALPDAQFVACAELAEFRALATALSNFVRPNEQAQDRRQDWASVLQNARSRRDFLAAQYAAYLLAFPVSSTVTGVYPDRFPRRAACAANRASGGALPPYE
jgi:hypothetical protein